MDLYSMEQFKAKSKENRKRKGIETPIEMCSSVPLKGHFDMDTTTDKWESIWSLLHTSVLKLSDGLP